MSCHTTRSPRNCFEFDVHFSGPGPFCLKQTSHDWLYKCNLCACVHVATRPCQVSCWFSPCSKNAARRKNVRRLLKKLRAVRKKNDRIWKEKWSRFNRRKKSRWKLTQKGQHWNRRRWWLFVTIDSFSASSTCCKRLREWTLLVCCEASWNSRDRRFAAPCTTLNRLRFYRRNPCTCHLNARAKITRFPSRQGLVFWRCLLMTFWKSFSFLEAAVLAVSVSFRIQTTFLHSLAVLRASWCFLSSNDHRVFLSCRWLQVNKCASNQASDIQLQLQLQEASCRHRWTGLAGWPCVCC